MTSISKIRTQRFDGYTEIKLLISHPMENGRNRDTISGNLIPAHFIQEIVIELNGKTVISAKMGGSVSKNPFFTFRLKNISSGDSLYVHWTDNLGLGDQVEHTIE